jgi:oligoribonuclease
VAKTAKAARGLRQLLGGDERGPLDGLDDQLRDAVAAMNFVLGSRVEVHQAHPELVAVPGVDQSRCIEDRHAVAQGEPATRLHKPGVAVRDSDRDTGRNERPPASRREDGALPRHQIRASVAVMGVNRQRQVGIQLPYVYFNHRYTLPFRFVLAWMDLEMTGLDPTRDTIVEIASLITDDNLEIMAEGPDLVIATDPAILDQMDSVVRAMHTKSGLLDAISSSSTTLADAGQLTLNFLKEHIPEPGTVPLCGNSIGTDRRFLAAWLPEVDRYLHYRSIDVSTIKELTKRWYPQVYDEAPKKAGGHRALDDIKESVEELKYYRATVFR